MLGVESDFTNMGTDRGTVSRLVVPMPSSERR